MEKKKWSRGIGLFLIFAIIICSMQIGFVVSAQDIIGATIVSYDMESSIDPIYWNATAGQSSEFAHMGTKSLKIDSTNPYGMGGFDLSSVTANKTYFFSFWTKIVSNSPYSNICVGVQENWGNIHQIFKSSDMIAGGDFAQCTFEYTIPAGVTSFRFFFFGDSDTAGGSFYVDDLTVVQNKPYISNTNIVDGEYDIPLNRSMEINFDMAMNVQSFDNITLNGSRDLISSVTASNGDKKATIVFDTLSEFTGYVVDLSGVENTYGTSIDDTVISFVTAESGVGETIINKTMDTEPTYKSGVYSALPHWGEGASTTPNALMIYFGYESDMGAGWYEDELSKHPGKTFEVSFDAAMLWGGGSERPLELRTKRLGTIARINPNGMTGSFQKFNFVYTVPETIPLGEDITYFWTDTACYIWVDNLVVKSVKDTKLLPISTPADNAQNVTIDSIIDLKFNNNINASTATNDNIKIDGGEVAITGITVVANTIKINAELDWAKTYTITTSNIKDAANRSVADVSKTFSTAPKYSIGLFDIYNENVKLTGTNIQAGEITAKLDSFTNNTDTEKNIILITSLYNGTELVGISCSPATINPKSSLSEPLTASLTVPSLDTGIFKLKSFVWDDLTKAEPIINSLELAE